MKYHQSYGKEKVDTTTFDTTLMVRLLKLLSPFRSLLLLSVLLMILSKAVEAVVPIFIGSMTQQILGTTITYEEVVHEGMGIIALILVTFLFDSVNLILRSWIGQKGILSLRTQVFEHMISLPLSYFNTQPVGRLMTRTIHDVEQIDQMFSESLVPIFSSMILFVCIAIGLLWLNWKLALMVFLIVPALLWLAQRFRNEQRRCYELVRSVLSSMNGFIQEHLMGAAIIRSFGLHAQEKMKFNEINEDYQNANIESVYNFSFFFAGLDFLQNSTLILIFAVLGTVALTTHLFDAGMYFTLNLYILMIFRPIGDLAERYNVLQSAFAAARRVFDILDQKPEHSPEGPSIQDIQEITFENVWFAYDPPHWILKDISFKIEKGESIAFVGITGAGKTTLINLLLRFYDVQKGSIKINGIDIRTIPLKELRQLFSLVLQDPFIFSGSITDNITLHNPHISHTSIEKITHSLQLSWLLKKLPHALSAGETQLLSLTRALTHNRPIFILDEATANIDSPTEKEIQRTLDKILEEKTSLIIAHRLSTIQKSSKIIVIHQGSIAEIGTHRQLLLNNSIYAKLHKLQT